MMPFDAVKTHMILDTRYFTKYVKFLVILKYSCRIDVQRMQKTLLIENFSIVYDFIYSASLKQKFFGDEVSLSCFKSFLLSSRR